MGERINHGLCFGHIYHPLDPLYHRKENPKLSDLIDVTDFNAATAGQRIVSDDHLHELVQS